MKRSVPARADDFRRDFAARALLAMLGTDGDKGDKVRAAVEYADRLIAELGRVGQPTFLAQVKELQAALIEACSIAEQAAEDADEAPMWRLPELRALAQNRGA